MDKSEDNTHKLEFKELVTNNRKLKQKTNKWYEESRAENEPTHSNTPPSNNTITNPETIQLDYLSSEDGGFKSNYMGMSDRLRLSVSKKEV
ncbi:hypothetical protein BB560_002785 [Smittium megazygosporum]|uniref:Uncharacterized protein n=1 Tax=Smittium megazygosporum TaxID=133381 RepID=A0A2T9ZDU3_9FUNG|nr:hypothetical protein BB560_002785 [Smittium megazygosporum]